MPDAFFRPSGLPPGGYHRSFADRVFTNWSFADREFANWPRLYNGLRTREVRRDGCSHQGERCSPNDHEFQHRSLLLPNLPQVDPNDRYEAISRAQTSDRTVSFLTYVAETARSFDDWAPRSYTRGYDADQVAPLGGAPFLYPALFFPPAPLVLAHTLAL